MRVNTRISLIMEGVERVDTVLSFVCWAYRQVSRAWIVGLICIGNLDFELRVRWAIFLA